MVVETKQRIAMVLEFDGCAFNGWQYQENAPTVQAALQQALAGIEREAVSCHAAGRTDAGVHAEALLVHTDVMAARWRRSPRAYLHGLNALLPASLRVVGVCAVADNFHARFDCRERAYRYQIWNRATPSALYPWRHWWMPRPVNLEAMQQAAAVFVGKQDFSALRASGCQAAHAIRTVKEIRIEQQGFCIMIHVRADAFLYRMVRNLVGNLVEAGLGKSSVQELIDLMASGDRRLGAATAPAHGLYFVDAVYDSFRAQDLIGRP